MPKYPRTLYRRDENGTLDFTNKEHRHIKYDSLIVENDTERDAAEEEGWIDDFHDALFTKEVKKEKKEKKEKSELGGF